MNMTEDELFDITPRAFANKAEGFNKARDFSFKKEMELHREVIISTIRPHLAKSHRNKSVKELYPLDWDNKAKETKQTKENPVDFWKRIDAKTKKKNG